MEQNQTPGAPQESANEPSGAELVGALMQGQGNSPTAPAERRRDEPRQERPRGDASPTESDPEGPPAPDSGDDSSAGPPSGDDTTQSVLERLKADYSKASERLHKERQEKGDLQQQLEDMRAELQALRSGQSQAQNTQQQQQAQPMQLSAEQVEQLGKAYDPDWETNREDPDRRYALQSAANMAADMFRGIQEQFNGVVGRVEDMQFNQRLSSLGISRQDFDHIWENDPNYASVGEGLSDEKRLNLLEAVARTTGSRPSQPAPSSGHGGAPATSAVDPRRTIEVNQGAGSASDPRRQSLRGLVDALENSDMNKASKEATPLFAQFAGMRK